MVTHSSGADARLIEEHIIERPSRAGVAEVVVKERYVPVWALIGRWLLTPEPGAAELVAQAYRIPPEAMQAAIAYYKKYQAEIDARLAALDEP